MKRFITNEPHGNLIELGKNENSILRYRYGISHSISETQFMVPGEQDCYICYYYIPRDSKSYYLCAYHSLCEYIDDLTNPLKYSISEKCTRIYETFVKAVGVEAAKVYAIQGKRCEARRIELDRNLVEWEQKESPPD